MKSCFFIGHHDIGEDIYPALLAEVDRHIVECGVTNFFVGRYGTTDTLRISVIFCLDSVRGNLLGVEVAQSLEQIALFSALTGSLYRKQSAFSQQHGDPFLWL